MIPNGGTFLRPGAIAWDGLLSPGPGSADRLGYSSCEVVEQAIAAALADLERLPELLDELAEARLWLPLPDGPKPVTDGSAIVLPVVMGPHPADGPTDSDQEDSGDFVPAFTSVQRLGTWADPRTLRADPASTAGSLRSGDPAWVRDLAAGTGLVRHIVVPFLGLVSLMPAGMGIAINPGSGLGLQLCPAAVACLAEGQPRLPGIPGPRDTGAFRVSHSKHAGTGGQSTSTTLLSLRRRTAESSRIRARAGGYVAFCGITTSTSEFRSAEGWKRAAVIVTWLTCRDAMNCWYHRGPGPGKQLARDRYTGHGRVATNELAGPASRRPGGWRPPAA